MFLRHITLFTSVICRIRSQFIKQELVVVEYATKISGLLAFASLSLSICSILIVSLTMGRTLDSRKEKYYHMGALYNVT